MAVEKKRILWRIILEFWMIEEENMRNRQGKNLWLMMQKNGIQIVLLPLQEW